VSKHLFKILITSLILFTNLALKAQNVNNKLPLETVIDSLESRFNIVFSYADESIKNIKIRLSDATLSLNEVLDYLNQNTKLNFEFLGKDQVVIRKSKSRNRPIKLEYLEEVLVTNYLTKGITLDNSGAVIIRPEEFGILPGLIEPDILQTIQALPGVTSIDETVSNLNVRGGTHDQNLILWDGIKMYQSGHFFGLISAFNPYLTKKVEVTKNGTSARYGDGVSSIINMQLDNTLNNEFKAGAGLNLTHADGFARIPVSDDLELQVSARRSVTDLIETPTYNQYFERIFQDTDVTNNQTEINNTVTTNEAFYFYDVGAKVLYDLSEKDKLRFNFLNIYNNLDYLEEATINDVDEALRSGITQRNLAAGIEYQRNWNGAFTTSLQVYASNYNLEATNFDIINDQRLIQENEVVDTGIKLSSSYDIRDNFNWSNGYQFFEVGISNLQDVNNPVFRSYIKEVIRSHSAFSEMGFISNNFNTHIKAGLRGTYFEKFGDFLLEPRLSFNQRFLNNFKFEVLGEFKSQTTAQIIDLQNDFLGIEKRRWILANNEDIPIIKSKQVSSGLHFKNNGLIISAEGYIKKVDGITTRSQGFQNQFQFVNAIGSYEIKGIDFLINKQFANSSTWLSYSYSKNDYNFDTLNNGEPFPNNADLRHAVTFAGTYDFNDLKFALGANWRTGKPFTSVNQQNEVVDDTINFNKPNQNNLEDYLRIDFSTTYNFDLGRETKAKVGLSIWNLLDKKNNLNTYYTLSDSSINQIENQSLGITPNVTFRVNF
jgi:hypothetical protein